MEFEIEFYDREKEIEEVMRILKAPPNLITFVYGPINSGKSSLMDEVVRRLTSDYAVFYVDLRERFIRSYEDFVRVLFKTHRSRVEDYKAFLARVLEGFNFEGLPIPKNLLIEFLKEKEVEDIFEYIITVFETVREKGRVPILILDEMQVIGDLKIDDLLIYRLFNLFVSITKKRHLSHVFAVTSDSLFLERVYSEAMLHGRCRYLLVDDFDYETTVKFLKKYGFKEEEIGLVWEYFGGKPVYLVEAVRERERIGEFCEEMFKLRLSQVLDDIYEIEDKKDLFDGVIKLFKAIADSEVVRYERVDESLKFCVRKNILFVEPVERVIKPQSRLDLLAIREVLRVLS